MNKLANEKKITETCSILKFFVFLHLLFSDGALAQLARAFDWQSRGREFDSHTLHKKNTCGFAGVFFIIAQKQLIQTQAFQDDIYHHVSKYNTYRLFLAVISARKTRDCANRQ